MTESIRISESKRSGLRSRGIELQSHKSASTRMPLQSAPLPNELILPLEGGLSARDIKPAVETGQRVLRGQPLVQGGGPLSTWTHASTSGVVRSLERRPVAHPRRREALCAVLEVDGRDESWTAIERPDPTRWDTPESLAAAMSRAGLAGLGGAVFPTGLKLAAAWRHRMRLVIINGVECEPYISCDDMLMRTAPHEVLVGAQALVDLTGAEQGVVVVEDDKPEALQALERALAELGLDQRLAIITVPAKYPAGGERQLIEALTGNEVPSLAKPTDIGYLCQNVGTAAALFQFLHSGRPVTARVTTVTGGAVATPRNLEVRLGMRIADLIDACGGYAGPVARLIKGGSMMGVALNSDAVPVDRATNCIIAATEQEIRREYEAMPCIRCGNCSDACPANLMPQDLFVAASRNEFDTLENLGLFDCIECGCCDVVCPSYIQLTDAFRRGKTSLVQAMDLSARSHWFDAREQLRRQRIERWEGRHGSSAGEDGQSLRVRLEAVADLIARVDRLGKASDISSSTGGTHV